jgi:spermidine synthase
VDLNARLRRTPALKDIPGEDVLFLYGELRLDERGVERCSAEHALDPNAPPGLVSSDDNLYLEYQTPKANVLGPSSAKEILDHLAQLGPANLPIINADSPGAEQHVEGARLAGSGRLADSIAALSRAEELGAPTSRLRDSVLRHQSEVAAANR